MKPAAFILNLSILLSELLNRIGASPFVRGLRRYYSNQEEWLYRMIYQDTAVELYVFGSRTEGTTTEGMESDRDILECYTDIKLIQSTDDAKGNEITFFGFIFDDENTHPGYVKLHLYSHDMPLGLEHVKFLGEAPLFNKYLAVENEKLLLMNGYGRQKFTCNELNGPARTDIVLTSNYILSLDRIFALKCEKWPKQARGWFHRETRKFWPSTKVQSLLSTFGCFITPVGHSESECQTVEWRLSLSKAERLLIWSLNDTQFKCIVLMKILTRQFVKKRFPDSITSYHCKNVVFSVIETTPRYLWQPRYLAICIHMCLLRLLQFVEQLWLPQYFIPENNLLRHKLKRNDSVEVANIIRSMIENLDYKFFLWVRIDDFGDMLCHHLMGTGNLHRKPKQKKAKLLLCSLALTLVGLFSFWRLNILCKRIPDCRCSYNSLVIIPVIKNHFKLLFQLQKSVIEFRKIRSINAANMMDMMTSHVCASLGHHLLCFAIDGNVTNDKQRVLFQMGFNFIREGFQHDNISNRLKCAHILYKCGLFNEALTRLKVIQEELRDRNKRSTLAVCKCRDTTQEVFKEDVDILSGRSLDALLGNVTAQCVFYLKTELSMTPKALVYEMFRSSGHETELEACHDYWMINAVVDPIILLYYLQFLCSRELEDVENQERALLDILNETISNPNLGHMETAINILGHCFMEQGFFEVALSCFIRSLNYNVGSDPDRFPAVEARFHVKRLRDHNAAKWHLCVCILHLIRRMELKV